MIRLGTWWLAVVVAVAAALSTVSSPAVAVSGAVWQVNLASIGGDVRGVARGGDGALRLVAPRRSALTGGRPGGLYTFGVHSLDRDVDQIAATPDATGPGVVIEVRLRRTGGGWSQWRPAAPSARMPFGGREVQARAVFTGTGAVLRGLRLRAVHSGRSPEATGEPLTYRVYATREGLVGHTTANGHVIVENDRFAALPSRRSLSSNGGHEYTVTVTYRGRSVTAPVWDVGPWNIADDYWSPPSQRETFADLPRGTPEAQAAKLDGYNGGKDGFGRTVLNPAGIDLADGTFRLDLKLTDNDWVDVRYDWTVGGGVWTTIVDDTTERGFSAGGAWLSANSAPGRYGAGHRYATPSTVDSAAWFGTAVPATDDYEVSVWYPGRPDHNPATRFLVRAVSGVEVVHVDQRSGGGNWVGLGVFRLAAGDTDLVGVSRLSAKPGYVVADAVRLTRR